MHNVIDSFQGQYRFLSNFYPARIRPYPNMETCESVEHAYQAAKAKRKEDYLAIMSCESPGIAKRMGRRIAIRDDWERIKDEVMLYFVRQKFYDNRNLGRLLLATGDAELIEGNHWNDQYWGVCNGKGQNKLGKILMQVREELKVKYGAI